MENRIDVQLHVELIEKISSMPWSEIAKLCLDSDSLNDEVFLNKFKNDDEIVNYFSKRHKWLDDIDNKFKRDLDTIVSGADYLLWSIEPSGVKLGK